MSNILLRRLPLATASRAAIYRPQTFRAIPSVAGIAPVQARTILGLGGKDIYPGGTYGSLNDDLPPTEENRLHGSYHWDFERIIAIGMIPSVLIPFAAGSISPVLDATLATIILIHCHLGLDSCIIDYLPKSKMPKVHKWGMGALYAGTGTALLGIYEYETNDIGISETIRKVWNA